MHYSTKEKCLKVKTYEINLTDIPVLLLWHLLTPVFRDKFRRELKPLHSEEESVKNGTIKHSVFPLKILVKYIILAAKKQQ